MTISWFSDKTLYLQKWPLGVDSTKPFSKWTGVLIGTGDAFIHRRFTFAGQVQHYHIRDALARQTRFVWVLWLWGVSAYVCALHDLVPPKLWNAFLNKWWRCALKQSIQRVHVPLSSWNKAVLGTQPGKVCYYSITHSSASSQSSHVSPVLGRLPALPLQV